MSKLTRYEQETIINFNAGEKMATVYTRDPAVIRQMDKLVIDYPDTFKRIGETDIDKTYEMLKALLVIGSQEDYLKNKLKLSEISKKVNSS